MEKNNPRTGSSFDAFLKEQGMYDDVTAKALKRAIAEQLREGMQGAVHYEGGDGCSDGY